MFLSDIKIVDLNRSVVDTSEMDSLKAERQKLATKLSSLKSPKKPKDETKLDAFNKAFADYEKKSKNLEMQILEEEDKIATLEKKEKKDRGRGRYKFKKKVYTNKEMADSLGGLDNGYYFKWNNNTERAIKDWQIKYGFELVTIKDPYLPEGADVDAEGNYVFSTDSVLMKITLRKYAEKQMIAQAKSDRAAAGKLKEFQTLLASKGVEASSDEFIEDWKRQIGVDDV